MISEFGKYQGYSAALYDGTQRTSEYLTLSDGTRLAYDLILPTKKGVPANKPLPVLFKYTPYGRAWTIFDKDGRLLIERFVSKPIAMLLRIRYRLARGEQARQQVSLLDPIFRDRWLGKVVSHGYAIVSVDRPGLGASFAACSHGSMEQAVIYETEIMDWIAAQPWSDGNIAMYGDSQQAMVQIPAAAAGNPHLKAILPAACPVDNYQSVEFPGGVFNRAFQALVESTIPLLDQLATPVDSDPDGALLARARDSRKGTFTANSVILHPGDYPNHDSLTAEGVGAWKTGALYPFIERINRTKTAIYMTVGWYDIFTADMFYWYNSLSVPRHLTVRPTDHSQVSASLPDLDYGTEVLRWLDCWLKDIDNGIMAEPPIHYYLQDGPKKGSWQTSAQWPPADQKLTGYYFGAGTSGSSNSINDGTLVTAAPANGSAPDAYTVDYSASTGTRTRWGAVEEAHLYPDLRAHDEKSLTYTTAPLGSDLEVTGHPVAHLWLSTATPDLDAFVYLEEVDGAGKSIYVTEGELRATHRKLVQAPFCNFGLPYQSHDCCDMQPIPAGEPFELNFALLPTAYRFSAGSRLRITLAFADAGNFDTPVLEPAPTLQLLRDADHPSYVEIPTIDTL
jgi:uncharacterized protein